MIEIPNRPSGEGVPAGARLLPRVARPLNGIEIAQALEVALQRMARQLFDEGALGCDEEMARLEAELALMKLRERLGLEWALTKKHLVWPGAGWKIVCLLMRRQDAYRVWVEFEIDLSRSQRIAGQAGLSEDGWTEMGRLEEEQLRMDAPDDLRAAAGLAIQVDYVGADGQSGKATLAPTERRAARSVDVGHGASPPTAQVEEPVVQPREERVEMPADELVAEVAPPSEVAQAPAPQLEKPKVAQSGKGVKGK